MTPVTLLEVQHHRGLPGYPQLFDCGWIHGASNQEIYNTIANGVPGSRMVAFAGRLPDGDEDTGKSSRS